MIPSVGRIVHFVMDQHHADAANKRRADAASSHIAQTESGAVVHVGNRVIAGDVYPMIVVRVWSEDAVNGQVFLDGNDTLWVTSVAQGGPEDRFSWFEPPRIAPSPSGDSK